MIGFDRIVCEYPLSDPRDQDREFVTRDLGGWGQEGYLITRDGRLIRHPPARREGVGLVKDVEWPVEGEIRMVDDDVPEAEAPVEYAVRFTGGRVEWIRRVRMEAGESAVPPLDASARGAMVPFLDPETAGAGRRPHPGRTEAVDVPAHDHGRGAGGRARRARELAGRL